MTHGLRERAFPLPASHDAEDGQLSAPGLPERRGLDALDARVSELTPGIVVVRASSGDAALAVQKHVLRRAHACSVRTVAARSRPGAPLWQDVLLQLDARHAVAPARERGVSAERLILAAGGRRLVVVAPMPAAGSWDYGVAAELASHAHPFLVVFVGEAQGLAGDPALQAMTFDVGDELDAAERESWWSAVAAYAAPEVGARSLPELDAWWGRARKSAAEPGATRARSFTEAENALVRALGLVGRPWRTSDVRAVGDEACVDGLVRDDVLREDAGWLTVEPPYDAPSDAAPPDVLRRLARVLGAHAPEDPWALARAAELLLAAGDVDDADAAIARALAKLDDAVARGEVAHFWGLAISNAPAEARVSLHCRACERALDLGEAEEAHRWARAAAAGAPDAPLVTLLLGRSLVALGDLVAAQVTLERGQRLVGAEGARSSLAAELAAELAELRYLTSDMAGARARAADVVVDFASLAPARSAFFKARNTLGKVLLAEARWDDADRHFAEDALTAASEGDATAELRARLNRGIAFLSNGALDEARALLEAVRADAERIGDSRAAAFALQNLAVVATTRHDYAEALTLSERMMKLRQRLGDRLKTALMVANIAELRRKLGLLDHAEHALAFGRRALGPGMPAERSAQFSLVAATVALDRGRTDIASREVARAIRDAEQSCNRKYLAEAHRVATRVALEDGDLSRARASLVASQELTATDEGRADAALLEALLARALGEDALALGLSALDLARKAGEEEVLLGAHLLLTETYAARGEADAARAHVAQAVALREQVISHLPTHVQAAFLTRRDVARITRLEARLAEARPDSIPAPADSGPSATDLGRRKSSPAGKSSPPLDMVGQSPLIRGLLANLKKVARASSTVLVRGESGTGKELVAAALHRASDRASGPMVTVNCAALVETLLLSELFGHEKGAFTGANTRRQGRFELAEGGTLFLDEIGDISAKTQVALLRVLQERTFERVGGATPIRVDVRVVCATHRDLRAMVERGEFREDLYYRLRGITLEVPPLRARMSDLPALADHLLGRIAAERGEAKKSLAPAALALLAQHRWPGNIRELDNALRAASLFAETDVIAVHDLTENVDDLRLTGEREALAQASEKARAAQHVSDAQAPSPAASTSGVNVADDSSETGASLDADDAAEWALGPLPSGEASATSLAYAQVRQGSLSLSDLKRQIERDCIARALAETKGNITKAAAVLGMKRPRLSQLVKQYGLATVASEAL